MDMNHIDVDLAGLNLEHPVMNAAGTCKVGADVERCIRSAASAVMIGSITMEPREGNAGSAYWYEQGLYSVNSLGMPNPGAKYWRFHLQHYVSEAHATGKPVIVSVAGFNPQEYGILAETMLAQKADAVELNLGCPNVWEGGRQKKIPSFDPMLIVTILMEVERRVGSDQRIGVKLSPFSDPDQLRAAADALTPTVKFITTTNTFPNAFLYNNEGKQRISPASGLAGMGGPAMKPVGLGQVRQFRHVLPPSIQIVGAGGVSSGKDVDDYRAAGATAVQVATAYMERGEGCLSVILAELTELPA